MGIRHRRRKYSPEMIVCLLESRLVRIWSVALCTLKMFIVIALELLLFNVHLRVAENVVCNEFTVGNVLRNVLLNKLCKS